MKTKLIQHFAQHILAVVAVLLLSVVITPTLITVTTVAPVAIITSLTLTMFGMCKMAIELYVQKLVKEANAIKG